MKELQLSELKKGLKVKDNDGNVGTLIHLLDIRNVVVKFENGTCGYAFYCLDPADKKHYDPLYKVE